MNNCVFCRIANHEQESEILYENEDIYAVKDILPQAPVHFLVIPKKHIVSAMHIEEEDSKLFAEMIMVANKMAQVQGISESGYKLVVNVGKDGGQVIPHLHIHVLGGKQMTKLH